MGQQLWDILCGSAHLVFEKVDFRDPKLQPIPVHTKPAVIIIEETRK